MKPAIEPPRARPGKTSLVAFERREAAFPWSWHYHPELELTLILEGRGTRLVGDHSEAYGPGDLVLLGSNLPHTWFSAPGSRRNRAIVVQFRRDALPEAVLALPEFAAVRRLLAGAGRGLCFPAAAARAAGPGLRALRGREGLPGWLGLAGVLGALAATAPAPLASAGHRHRRSARLSSRLERVTAHLEKHYRDDLRVAQVARRVGLSPGAFSRFFLKMTRRTFVDYRNGLRVREACRLLEETDLPVTEIAYACGFNNLANFNRRFLREKGLVPLRYRRLHEPAPGGT